MEAKDLLQLITEYNSRKEEIFDRCADMFVSKVRNELEGIYNRGDWTRMVDVTQLGISVENLSDNFQKFEFHDILLGYLMKFGETIQDEFHLQTFQEFIENEDYKEFDLYSFQNEEILQIQPFYEALKRKGFECYVDTGNYQLVVALNIKQ